MFRIRKAQSTLEYAIIISVVIAGLLVINTYMKKGFMGRMRESTDQIGKQFDPSLGFTNAWKATSSGNTVTVESRNVGDGSTTSAITSSETITKEEHDKFGSAGGATQ